VRIKIENRAAWLLHDVDGHAVERLLSRDLAARQGGGKIVVDRRFIGADEMAGDCYAIRSRPVERDARGGAIGIGLHPKLGRAGEPG
jgi:hypothetical protein